MVATKKIKSIEIIKAGSNPDVDSDFNTTVREKAVEYVTNLYGKDNVCNIITFGTLAAKGAIKAMCNIYNIPFVQAGKIAALVPPPIEGVECSLEDIYNPDSDRYTEAAEFRAATSTPEWQPIIEGARNIEGRNKSTGVHACGIIISSEPLHDVIPLQVRQDDGRVITQWTYPELEDMGLIKMDFLGLDTVDLIQHSVEYIIKSGKTPPNMLDIIHGKMDDPKTYKLFQDANTIGVFQFGSEMVRNLLKLMKPTNFNDLSACTAVARPGPMHMLSHIKYADRKNGREDIDYIHPAFKNSPLETILGDTFGLCVYQEQIMRIASDIAGMTLQEGDDLRKAMGKKKMAVMMSMKPKFFEGALANGYPEEAISVLWDTIAEFAKYGFNKSHSVAYAMNAYQSAYLKANYPIEFMAALIAQNVGDKKKTLSFLREANRMGISVGTIDINLSGIKVAPDFAHHSGKDILFGIGGVSNVSDDVASIIVDEREKNGIYTSVQNFVDRCMPLGLTNRKVYESLAMAGAFDRMGVSRKAVVEQITNLMGDVRVKNSKGTSLFDMLEEDDPTEIPLDGPDYPHTVKLQKEADMVGLYLTGHPLEHAGQLNQGITIAKLLKTSKTSRIRLTASIIEIVKKSNRNGKSLILSIDDGTDYMTARLSPDVVKGLDKTVAQDTIRKVYEAGDNDVSKEARAMVLDNTVKPLDELELNAVYVMEITFRPGKGDNPYSARITSLRPLRLADDGTMPIRIRFKTSKENLTQKKKLAQILPKNLGEKIPGRFPIHVALYGALRKVSERNTALYETALNIMDEDAKAGRHPRVDAENALKTSQQQHTLAGESNHIVGKQRTPKKNTESIRTWPPALSYNNAEIAASPDEVTDAVETLNYVDSGYRTGKTQKVEEIIERYVGVENYDFGIFDPSILSDTM